MAGLQNEFHTIFFPSIQGDQTEYSFGENSLITGSALYNSAKQTASRAAQLLPRMDIQGEGTTAQIIIDAFTNRRNALRDSEIHLLSQKAASLENLYSDLNEVDKNTAIGKLLKRIIELFDKAADGVAQKNPQPIMDLFNLIRSDKYIMFLNKIEQAHSQNNSLKSIKKPLDGMKEISTQLQLLREAAVASTTAKDRLFKQLKIRSQFSTDVDLENLGDSYSEEDRAAITNAYSKAITTKFKEYYKSKVKEVFAHQDFAAIVDKLYVKLRSNAYRSVWNLYSTQKNGNEDAGLNHIIDYMKHEVAQIVYDRVFVDTGHGWARGVFQAKDIIKEIEAHIDSRTPDDIIKQARGLQYATGSNKSAVGTATTLIGKLRIIETAANKIINLIDQTKKQIEDNNENKTNIFNSAIASDYKSLVNLVGEKAEVLDNLSTYVGSLSEQGGSFYGAGLDNELRNIQNLLATIKEYMGYVERIRDQSEIDPSKVSVKIGSNNEELYDINTLKSAKEKIARNSKGGSALAAVQKSLESMKNPRNKDEIMDFLRNDIQITIKPCDFSELQAALRSALTYAGDGTGKSTVSGKELMKDDYRTIIKINGSGGDIGEAIAKDIADYFHSSWYRAVDTSRRKAAKKSEAKTKYNKEHKIRYYEKQIQMSSVHLQSIVEADKKIEKDWYIRVRNDVRNKTKGKVKSKEEFEKELAAQLKAVREDIFDERGTVKFYQSFSARTGFTGGSLGAGVREQISNILNIYEMNGASIPNQAGGEALEALTFLALNSFTNGPSNKYLTQLEQFLILGAESIMFDGGYTLGNRALEDNTVVLRRVNMYHVNDLFVPESFVLDDIIGDLEKIGRGEKATNNNQIKITNTLNYIGQDAQSSPPEVYANDFGEKIEDTYGQAIGVGAMWTNSKLVTGKADISFHFLKNYIGLVNNVIKTINGLTAGL